MKLSFPRAEIPFQFAGEINSGDWNSATWQLRHSLKTHSDFTRWFRLSADENAAFATKETLFNVRTTPYYASLCRENPLDPLRRILMPTALEFSQGMQAQLDPLGERKNNPAPRIVHRYPDRALFLITDVCTVYCRYCTRKHFTGGEQAFIKESEYAQALDYLKSRTGIREVILSGGDPLTLSNSLLGRVLTDLRKIEHLEIIRIGSRVPVVCPMRIDEALIQTLRPHRPIYFMTHFNHPRELTGQAKEALDLLVDAGIPVMNQMVLLNGVNNHPAIVQALSRRLLYLRVKPYYMFQCDPSEGTDHLRISIEESESIQRELWGNLSGLAMPNLSLDIPSGGGKVPLFPNFEIERDKLGRRYSGWDGVKENYLNPPADQSRVPLDVGDYSPEWDSLRSAKNQT